MGGFEGGAQGAESVEAGAGAGGGNVLGGAVEEEGVVCGEGGGTGGGCVGAEVGLGEGYGEGGIGGEVEGGVSFSPVSGRGSATCGEENWGQGTILHYGYINRGSGARPVDLLLFHD